jgi:hypothetical protein
MPEAPSLLMLPFLDWVASRPRTYAEAMDAWRTSCPRLSVWEDALIDGFIQVNGCGPARHGEVALTARGRAVLDGARRPGSVQSTPGIAARTDAAPDRRDP